MDGVRLSSISEEFEVTVHYTIKCGTHKELWTLCSEDLTRLMSGRACINSSLCPQVIILVVIIIIFFITLLIRYELMCV